VLCVVCLAGCGCIYRYRRLSVVCGLCYRCTKARTCKTQGATGEVGGGGGGSDVGMVWRFDVRGKWGVDYCIAHLAETRFGFLAKTFLSYIQPAEHQRSSDSELPCHLECAGAIGLASRSHMASGGI
jgi:hypothetical protein